MGDIIGVVVIWHGTGWLLVWWWPEFDLRYVCNGVFPVDVFGALVDPVWGILGVFD